jgi:hypothetical protein
MKSRRVRLVEHVTRLGEMRNAYKILVGNPEGKRPLERTKRKWNFNIRKDYREIK